jgi:two-component system, CAI-1 autoinducer sensor kinase/phosphatase CqsS
MAYSSSGKKGGTGLGLSFCRRVLKSFSSSIKCDSVVGEWTEFTIAFPSYDSHQVQEILGEIQEKKKDSTPAHPVFIQGKTILLADDDVVSSKMTGRILTTLGFTVICAQNGQEVLEILDQRSVDLPIDLILMDIEMPIMNGIQTSKAIRQSRHKDIPIIASTVNTSEEKRQIIKDAGINDVLGKPFFKEEFVQILADWFNK